MPSDAFHLFPMLPAELRLKIWIYSFPGSRVLEVVWSGQEWTSIPQSRHKLSSAPFANREANAIFRVGWSRLCLQESMDWRSQRAGSSISYFNPKIDTLYIGAAPRNTASLSSDAIDALLAIECIPSLRYLAIETREWQNGVAHSDWQFGVLSRFPKLQSFIIADYDIDFVWLETGAKRPVGEIEFVYPSLVDSECVEDLAPYILGRLKGVPRRPLSPAIPPATVMEVIRGGVRMSFI